MTKRVIWQGWVTSLLFIAALAIAHPLSGQVSGSITFGSTVAVSISTSGQNAQLTFSGTAGQQVNVEVTGSTFPGGCYSMTIKILKPDGSTLSSNNLCGQGNAGFSFVTLPTTGTYTFVLAPQSGGTGTANVTLSTDVIGSLTSGVATPVAISIPGQNAQLTFSGTAGQQVNVEVTGSTFPGGCYSMTIKILKPDGSTLSSNNLCGQGNAGFSFVTPPTTGTYTFVLAPQSGGTGTANVTLSTDVMGSLTSGVVTPVAISIPGQNARLTFSGTAGQQVNVEVTNSTFPGCASLNLRILKPDGSILSSTDVCGQTNKGLQFVTLPTTGTYTVALALNNGGTGTANVTLSTDILGSLTPGVATPVTINIPGQNAQLTFSGTAGQQVNVEVTNSTFPGCASLNLRILKPDGSILSSTDVCGQTNKGLQFVTLPTTGTYTVALALNNGGTGTANVTLSTDVLGSLTPGVVTPVTINIPGQNAQLTFSGTAGQQVNVEVTNSTFPGCASLNLRILKPDGSMLNSTDVCGQTNKGLQFVTLPTTGTYTVALALNNGGTGTANVTLSTDVLGSLTPGVVTPVTISIPGQNAQLVFSGSAGKQASLQITNNTFSSGCTSVILSIWSPGGSTLTSTASCGGNISLGPVTLPATGTYSAVIAPQSGRIGSSVILLWESDAQTLTPTFSVGSGTYTTNQVVTLADATVGASIYYTTDGTTPTTSSTLYSSPITVGFSETVQAVAKAPNYLVSSVASATYAIVGPPTISSISPSSGIVGTTITITGSNFGPSQGDSIATLGGTVLTPTAWSSTRIAAKVPVGAISGNVVVTVAGAASNGLAFAVVDPTTGFRRTITIDHTKVPNSDQANFPVLISGTYPYLATQLNAGRVLNANGYDIIFTSDVAGQSPLDFEIDSYNPTTGAAAFWVSIPILSHTVDTTIYMWYGIAGINDSQENRAAVWGSNYVGVWHLPDGTTLSSSDSTANANNGTISGTAATSGEIAGAASFNGTSNYIQLPQLNVGNTLSASAWFKTGSNGVIFGNANATPPGSTSSSDPILYVGSDSKLRGGIYNGSGTPVNMLYSSGAVNDGNWHLASYATDGTAQNLYLDGQLQASASAGNNSSLYYFIGTDQTNSWANTNNSWLYFSGSIDEVRLSNVALSSDWIATEYNNQSVPSTFFSTGQEYGSAGALPTILNVTPNPALSGQWVTVTGTGFGSSQGSSALTLNGALLSPTTWTDTSITFNLPTNASSGPLAVQVGNVLSFPTPFIDAGNSSYDDLIGTACPTPAQGEYVAWATPTQVSKIETDAGSVSATVAGAMMNLIRTRPLATTWEGAAWTKFQTPSLPPNAIIKGIYGAEQWTLDGTDATWVFATFGNDPEHGPGFGGSINGSGTAYECTGNMSNSMTVDSIKDSPLATYLWGTMLLDNLNETVSVSNVGWAIYFSVPNQIDLDISATRSLIGSADSTRVHNGKVITHSYLDLFTTELGNPVPGVGVTLESSRPSVDTIIQAFRLNWSGHEDALIETWSQPGSSTITSSTSGINVRTPATVEWLPARYVDPFLVTCYVTSLESDFLWSPLTTSLIPNLPAGKQYHQKFIDDIRMQGSGLTLDNTYIHYERTTNLYSEEKCALMANQKCAIDNKSSAVDPSIIPMGSTISIDSIGTRPATDSGGGIIDDHVDVYFGTRRKACLAHGKRYGDGVTFLSY